MFLPSTATIGMTTVVTAVAAVAMCAPVAAVWLALLARSGAGMGNSWEVVGGLGAGLIAAGAAGLLGTAFEWLTEWGEPFRLTVYAPVSEEILKALAILAAIGPMVVARARRLTLLRCAVATAAVVAAFAASENLGHLGTRLVAGDLAAGDTGAVLETLRVRAVLPPLGHAAESWPVGAAIWLAARTRRTRRGRRGRRASVLLGGLLVAIAVHSLWNASALRWWPQPWPLLAILAGSFTAVVAAGILAARRERRERLTLPASSVHIPGHRPGRHRRTPVNRGQAAVGQRRAPAGHRRPPEPDRSPTAV